MTETRKPDPTDPADAGADDAPKPQPGESFLEPGDADGDETAGSDGADGSGRPSVPPPPD